MRPGANEYRRTRPSSRQSIYPVLHDPWHRETKSSAIRPLRSNGSVSSRIVTGACDTAGSELSSVRRLPRHNWHPKLLDVVSNIPFIAIGAVGLRRFRDDQATIVLFLGFFLTGIGSSYYHWDPHDATLFWDRLPMTLSFAAILALVVSERVNARAGAILLWPALAIGLFSLLLWRWTDDPRLYFWVQFFPCLAVLLLFLLYPPKYTGTYYWLSAAALYALAKVFEFSDGAIYLAGHYLSGHTLKHLAAAAACFAILRYFQNRRLIT